MAPLWWVQQIVAHAVTVVPPSKVQVGVPAYGRNFVAGVTGTCPPGVVPDRYDVRNVNTAALIQEKGATPVRDPASGEMTFSYVETFTGPPPGQVTCQVTRTVWYPDLDSMMAKAHLVGTYGISGIAQWALGMEDPAQWQPLRDYAASLPHPGGTDAGRRGRGRRARGRQPGDRGWLGLRPGVRPADPGRDHDGRRPVGRAGQRRPSRPGVRLSRAWVPTTGSATRSRRRGAGSPCASRPSASATARPRRRSAARRSRSADRGVDSQPAAARSRGPTCADDAPRPARSRTARARAAGQSASAACTRAMEPSTSTGSNQTVSSPHSSAPRRLPRWSSTKTTVAGSGSPRAASAAW